MLFFFLQRLHFYRKVAICLFGVVLLVAVLNLIVERKQSKALRDFINRALYVKPLRFNDKFEDSWQIMGYESLRHMIYSAIFDRRTDRIGTCKSCLILPNYRRDNEIHYGSVKVFAFLPSIINTNIKTNYNDWWTKIAVDIVHVYEDVQMAQSGYIINCPLTSLKNNSIVILPEYVSLAFDFNPQTYALPTFVKIRYPQGNIMANSFKNLSACVGILHGNYSNVLRFVEFIEVYRILAVEKFYVYTQAVSSDIEKVLTYYMKLEIIEILSWNLDKYGFREFEPIDALASNECVYRSTFADGFKYTAIVNIDEVLMPFRHSTLTDFITEIDDGRTNSFNFLGVFFYMDYRNDSSSVPDNVSNRFLYTQVKIERTKYPLPTYIQNKYIVSGEKVFKLHNRGVLSSVPGTFQKNVLPKDALLFQYRTAFIKEFWDAPLTTDIYARRFGRKIWDKVDEICKALFASGVCPLEYSTK